MHIGSTAETVVPKWQCRIWKKLYIQTTYEHRKKTADETIAKLCKQLNEIIIWSEASPIGISSFDLIEPTECLKFHRELYVVWMLLVIFKTTNEQKLEGHIWAGATNNFGRQLAYKNVEFRISFGHLEEKRFHEEKGIDNTGLIVKSFLQSRMFP